MKQMRSKAVLMSKRANVFYLEHARVIQKNDRVVYLNETGEAGEAIETVFNIPEKNTAFILLGRGTSITNQAAGKLAAEGVMVGFAGSEGGQLHSAMEPVFFPSQSEYRPTEDMQEWVKLWFDETRRLRAGKQILLERIKWTLDAWDSNVLLSIKKIVIPDALVTKFKTRIQSSATATELLSAEAEWTQSLYGILKKGYKLEFKREEGKTSSGNKAETINMFLDHGNYLAYGYSAVVLNTLGISFAFPLLHGKTRRGALVFDVADLFKDAIVMPLAFEYGSLGKKDNELRAAVIEACHTEDVLDKLFDTLKLLLKN